MTHRPHRSYARSLLAAAALLATPSLAADDGAPPDLSGVWDNGDGVGFVRPQRVGESICLFGCASAEPEPVAEPAAAAAPTAPPPPPDRPRYKPEYAAVVADLEARQVELDPVLRCMPPGVPRIGPPDKIVQTGAEIVFLYDDVSGPFFRVVPTDGRDTRYDHSPSHLGYSVGAWEGDTLVVETVNFTDESWLTDDGSFHTPDLRVVERLRLAGDQLEWRATAHDPDVLAEPWELRPRLATRSNASLEVSPPCIERDLAHMADATSHDNPR
jgi:hypothetical protein